MKTLLLCTLSLFLCRSLNAQVEWVFLQGFESDDEGNGIVMDSENNIYVAGIFEGPVDFDPTSAVHTETSFNYYREDFFLQKLDANKNLLWIKTFGGGCSSASVRDLHIDSEDNIYIVGGFTGSADFDPSENTFDIAAENSSDGFVSKMDTDGNLIWAKTVRGYNIQYVNAITTDGDDNIYLAGEFFGDADMDPGTGTAMETHAAIFQNPNAFFCKWTPDGEFAWGESFRGDIASANDIQVDDAGNIYVIGHFSGQMDVDPGAGEHFLSTDNFRVHSIVKLDSARNFLWAKSGTGIAAGSYAFTSLAQTAALDHSGNLYVGGVYGGLINLNYGEPAEVFINESPYYDVFVQKLSADGEVEWSRDFGSQSATTISEIKVSAGGEIYLTGSFAGAVDFSPQGNGSAVVQAQTKDIYLLNWTASGTLGWLSTFGGICDYSNGADVVYDNAGNFYGTGSYNGNMNIGMDLEFTQHHGYNDCAVYKVARGTSTAGTAEADNSAVTVFPNPAQSLVTISGIDEGTAQLFTTDGRLLQTIDLEKGNIIDLDAMPEGVYQLVIVSGTHTLQKRIVRN